ncbi:MAG: hypothetical protein WBH21_11050 [Vibrio anguillarum]
MTIKAQYPVFKARLVMGSPTSLNTKNHEGVEQHDEKKHHWFMGFAVPKGAVWDSLYSVMYNAAANEPSCTAALCGQAGFNWKTEDCDAPENPQNKGKASYPAGHMLIKFTRYKAMGPVTLVDGNFTPIINPSAIKRGDYFHISASTGFNGAATVKTNAGVYQNIDGLMFAEAGEEIVGEGGFDARSAFAGIQGGTVPGATTPPPAAQATTPPPAHDLVQPQVPGNVTPPPAPPAPPVVEQGYIVSGVSYTKAQLLAMPGWTEEHLATLPRG